MANRRKKKQTRQVVSNQNQQMTFEEKAKTFLYFLVFFVSLGLVLAGVHLLLPNTIMIEKAALYLVIGAIATISYSVGAHNGRNNYKGAHSDGVKTAVQVFDGSSNVMGQMTAAIGKVSSSTVNAVTKVLAKFGNADDEDDDDFDMGFDDDGNEKSAQDIKARKNRLSGKQQNSNVWEG